MCAMAISKDDNRAGDDGDDGDEAITEIRTGEGGKENRHMTWDGLANRVFFYQVVIDGKGHLLGRLASIVAKQLLNGQKIVVVRCEALNISGEFFRAKRTLQSFHPERPCTGRYARAGASNEDARAHFQNTNQGGVIRRTDKLTPLYSEVPRLPAQDDPLQPYPRR